VKGLLVAHVRGCEFPDHLLYDVPNLIWYEPLHDGTIRVGLTPVATALSGQMLGFTPKRAGKEFEKGRSFATIESGKWVGPARAAFDGTVVTFNESLMNRPTIANDDCYGAGWMLTARAAASDWRQGLVTGSGIGPAFEAWMTAENFTGCGMP
jgi:glycine cleavage system H protein